MHAFPLVTDSARVGS